MKTKTSTTIFYSIIISLMVFRALIALTVALIK